MSSDRRDQFKPPLTPEEARARRTELSVSVRKVKREGNLLKRRALRASPAPGVAGHGPNDPRSWSSAPPEGAAHIMHASNSSEVATYSTTEMEGDGSSDTSGRLGQGTLDSSSQNQGAWLRSSSPLSSPTNASSSSGNIEANADALTSALLTAPTLEGALAAAWGVRQLLASDHPPTELMVGACEGKLVPRLLELLCNEVSRHRLSMILNNAC